MKILEQVVGCPPMFGHGSPHSYRLSQMLRALLRQISAEYVAIAVYLETLKPEAHPHVVVGLRRLAGECRVLGVEGGPKRPKHYRAPGKACRKWGHGESSDRIDIGVGKPKASVDRRCCRLRHGPERQTKEACARSVETLAGISERRAVCAIGCIRSKNRPNTADSPGAIRSSVALCWGTHAAVFTSEVHPGETIVVVVDGDEDLAASFDRHEEANVPAVVRIQGT